eukprot:TRINITY_DN1652_c0_g1_i6.p1 TRINITY_DN1652_c0_g1~~TRINITY_DN1652_c0_g1_i6.p1  ORF type:complete len:537 (-),score=124.56 TRINITY_DN1652_c0_g1_i6:256-1749(-)
MDEEVDVPLVSVSSSDGHGLNATHHPNLPHHQTYEPAVMNNVINSSGEPQHQEMEAQNHVAGGFRLSPLKWLFLIVAFYCILANDVVTDSIFPTNVNYIMEEYFVIHWPTIGLDIVECSGAAVFAWVLSRWKSEVIFDHQHHGHRQAQFISATIVVTVVLSVVFGVLLEFWSTVRGLYWTAGFIANFFIGGCLLTMTTLLAWNTNQRNSPFWFGLLGGFRAASPIGAYYLFAGLRAQFVFFVLMACLSIVLIVWVLAFSKLPQHSRSLVPHYLNYGRHCITENTLPWLYLGQCCLSMVISLYATCSLVFDNVSGYNALAVVTALLSGAAGIYIHQRLGWRRASFVACALMFVGLALSFVVYLTVGGYVSVAANVLGNWLISGSYAIFFTIFFVASKNLIQDLREASPASLPMVYAIGYAALKLPGDLLANVPVMYIQLTPVVVIILVVLGLAFLVVVTYSINKLSPCADGKNTAYHYHHYGAHPSVNSAHQHLATFS